MNTTLLNATDVVLELQEQTEQMLTTILSLKFSSMSQRRKNDYLHKFLANLEKLRAEDAIQFGKNYQRNNSQQILEQLFDLQDQHEQDMLNIKTMLVSNFKKNNTEFILNHLDLQERYEDVLLECNDLKQRNNLLNEQLEKQKNQLQKEHKTKSFSESAKKSLQKQLADTFAELEYSYEQNLLLKKQIKDTQQKFMQQICILQEQLENNYNLYQTEKTNAILLAHKHLTDSLYATQEELEYMYLRTTAPNNKQDTAIRFGATEKVKQSFTYQLGAVFVRKANKINFKNIPVDILKLTGRFISEKISNELNEMQFLQGYADAEEAELIKNHLSYRLGSRLMKDLTHLNTVKNMPIHLLEEYFSFKSSKKQPESNSTRIEDKT